MQPPCRLRLCFISILYFLLTDLRFLATRRAGSSNRVRTEGGGPFWKFYDFNIPFVTWTPGRNSLVESFHTQDNKVVLSTIGLSKP